jgi:hypothetical protein
MNCLSIDLSLYELFIRLTSRTTAFEMNFASLEGKLTPAPIAKLDAQLSTRERNFSFSTAYCHDEPKTTYIQEIQKL